MLGYNFMYNMVQNQIMPVNNVEQTIALYLLTNYCGVTLELACIIVLFL